MVCIPNEDVGNEKNHGILNIMMTTSFNVTEEVKNTFNEMFRGRNQNAIISNLMMRAIEEEKMKRKRVQAINALLALRQSISPVTIYFPGDNTGNYNGTL
jgi:hypothetical protein